MFRTYLLVLGWFLSLFATAASAQPTAHVVNVIATGTFNSYSDQFEFQITSSAGGLESGVLQTGGVPSTYTVTNYVPETRTRTVPRTVYRIVNGRLVAETVYEEQTYTVMKPVYETRTVLIPANGKWVSIGGYGLWWINAASVNGVVAGFGIRQGDSVLGNLRVITLPPGGLPSVDSYLIETAPADPPSPCM